MNIVEFKKHPFPETITGYLLRDRVFREIRGGIKKQQVLSLLF
jgi:hypothetical protein